MSFRKSILWSYSSMAANFIVGFGASVVIARLLTPKEFGTFVLSNALYGLVALLTSFGLAQYVIREKDDTGEAERSAWTFNLLLQLGATALLLVLAVAIRPIYGNEVGIILAVAAINPVLSIFDFMPQTLLQKQMRFGIISAASFVSNLATAGATIALALSGYGALSLGLGVICGHVLSAIVLIASHPRGAMMKPVFGHLGQVAKFSGQMIGIVSVSNAAMRICDLILGKIQGPAGFGLYARASQIYSQFYHMICASAANAVFARLAREVDDQPRFSRTYLNLTEAMTGILWPACLGIAVLSRPLIEVVYGERWLGAAVPLSLLLIAVFINLAILMYSELSVLSRQTTRQIRFEWTRATVGTAAFALGAMHSIEAAAAARIFDAMVGYFLYRPHMPTMSGCSDREFRGMQLRSLAVSAAAIGPSTILMLTTGFSPRTPLLWIGASIAGGIVCWLAALFLTRHALRDELVRFSRTVNIFGARR